MSIAAHPATPSKPRRSASDREARRGRIFARLQEGWSYDRIAGAEELTRERVRQIIVETLARRAVDPSREHAILQIARLDPALRLASERIAAGDLRAVDPLLRVLDRLDKYRGVAAALGMEDDDPDGDAAKFDAKLADLIARSDDATSRRIAAAEGREESDFQTFSAVSG